MELPVVIDGNNLQHAAQSAEALSLLIGRAMLCDRLGRWAKLRRERVHVVFDGPAPAAPLAQQIANPQIRVSYSGAGVSADSVVIELIATDSAASRLLVVSSDHAIQQAAKRRRARPIRSAEFWAAVNRDLAQPVPRPTEPEEKERGLGPTEAEQWMREFGFHEPP
jgi:uncharacterized protein